MIYVEFHHDRVRGSLGFDDFVRVLFPKQDKYRVAAAWFLKVVGENEGIDGYEVSKLCRDKGISRATLQKVFVKLRAFGLVERRSGRYFLSNEFSGAVRRLGDAWRNINKEKKFEFNEDVLKFNFEK